MVKQQKSMRIDETTYADLVRYKSQISTITGQPVSFDNAIMDLLKIVSSKKYYCVYQPVTTKNVVIFGVGRTVSEAQRDVMVSNNLYDEEGLETAECTKEVYMRVMAGHVDGYLEDGTVTIAA